MPKYATSTQALEELCKTKQFKRLTSLKVGMGSLLAGGGSLAAWGGYRLFPDLSEVISRFPSTVGGTILMAGGAFAALLGIYNITEEVAYALCSPFTDRGDGVYFKEQGWGEGYYRQPWRFEIFPRRVAPIEDSSQLEKHVENGQQQYILVNGLVVHYFMEDATNPDGEPLSLVEGMFKESIILAGSREGKLRKRIVEKATGREETPPLYVMGKLIDRDWRGRYRVEIKDIGAAVMA